MQDPALCLSVLPAAVGFQSLRRGESPESVQALELYSRALSTIRRPLQADTEGANDVTILAATYLWRVATNMPDLETLWVHADFVRGLVKARGGLNALGFHGSIAHYIR
jgi:hypothetical protein